ncbi:MAG: oxaloacetate decarboxylase [Dehalococcoidia bacterium]|nr:oxaloacetate decarboxylase [Dehalococcoidia bacterium]
MSLASFTARREALRAILERPAVTAPGSVFDAASGRLAMAAGYEVGLFAGSVASHVILGAPDIIVLTLTELVEQTRRITRATELPLVVDADHGYGNALNVMRTVVELEAAGAAALTVEDSVLPRRYGGVGGPGGEIISREEYGDKLKAAIAARTDPALVIIGRTEGMPRGLDEALARVRIAREAGVDMVFVRNVNDLDSVKAIYEASGGLPMVLNTTPGSIEELAANGMRLFFQGHAPYFVMLNALYESYQHILRGGAPADLNPKTLPAELLAIALDEAEYGRLGKEYLGG